MAQKEVPSREPIPEPSLAPIYKDTLPSAPALEQEQPISQDPPAASVLDLNEHAEDHPHKDWQDLYVLVLHFEQFIIIILF